MAQIVPAMKGRMGGMDYYMISMKASKLIGIVKTPKDVWEDASIEERYQRDINLTRVKNQLARYWAEYETHFFGSIVAMVANFGDVDVGEREDFNEKFESILPHVKGSLPDLYKETAKDIGFLTLPDSVILVPLDGQHRAKAIEFAITGKDGNGKDLAIKSNTELGKEDISVLLVVTDIPQARSIFTHVNRYAKPTTAGQNYVTSDDDFLAVLAREITNGIFTARLVKYDSSSLNKKDRHFTTLATIYSCHSELAKDEIPGGKFDTTQLPSDDIQEHLREKANEVWGALVQGIDVYKDALGDKKEGGDEGRKELRGTGGNLLARPIPQECLFRAFLRLTNSPTNYSYDSAIAKLNKIPWQLTKKSSEKIWQNVLWTGDVNSGRIVYKNRNLATDIIFYLAGGKFTSAEEKAEMLRKYQDLFPENQKPETLPSLSGIDDE